MAALIYRFTYSTESRLCWFAGGTFEPESSFIVIGLLLGLALYNSTLLDLHFPLAFYKLLLGQASDATRRSVALTLLTRADLNVNFETLAAAAARSHTIS